jgi:hypothetical protein
MPSAPLSNFSAPSAFHQPSPPTGTAIVLIEPPESGVPAYDFVDGVVRDAAFAPPFSDS